MRRKDFGRISRLALVVAMIVFLVFDTSVAGCFKRYMNRRQCQPAADYIEVCCPPPVVCCPPVDCCVSTIVEYPIIEYGAPIESCHGGTIIHDSGHSADHSLSGHENSPEPAPVIGADHDADAGDTAAENAEVDRIDDMDIEGSEDPVDNDTEAIDPPSDDNSTDDDIFGETPADDAATDDDIFTELPVDDAASDDDLFSAEPDAAATDDDLFTEEPSIVPEDEVAPATDDDIFGGEDDDVTPDDAATPTEDDIFAPTDEDPSIDDIFDSTDASETGAIERIADSSDDLFAEPGTESAPGEDSVDALFDEGDSSDDDIDALFDGAKIEGSAAGFREVKPVSVRRSGDLPFRLWTDNTRNYRTVGRLVQITGTHVRMLKDNGKYSTVLRTRLSKEDSQYVQEMESSLGVRDTFDAVALR